MAELAGRQHGVVDLRQLVEIGLGAGAVRARVTAGRLHRVHRGVYAVGHPLLSRGGLWMAAVLACGPGAVLSHRDAAAHLNLRPSARATIDVTVPLRSHRRRPGIDVHRPRHLHPADTTVVEGIPCTRVARTLLDIAEVVGRRALARACEQAEVLRLFDRRELDALLARAPTRRGTARLAAVLADLQLGETATRSQLEELFLAVCQAAGIPRPHVNAWIDLVGGGVEADFVWRAQRLVVEVDGYESHGTRFAFERDRERDRRLRLAGWTVIRFTWRQLERDPGDVAATVRALLAEA